MGMSKICIFCQYKEDYFSKRAPSITVMLTNTVRRRYKSKQEEINISTFNFVLLINR